MMKMMKVILLLPLVAQVVQHQERVQAVLLRERVQALQGRLVLRQRLRKRKIRVGWLNIGSMMMVLNGLKMKMRLGITKNQAKPIGLFGKIR
jgi:hypothetical protein